MEQQRIVDAAFPGSGEIAVQMRKTDWAKTRLGPVEHWPGSLRTMLGVILGSRFPMMIWWGPDLLNFYNDAYRPILRDKHPKSLAAPAAKVWAEIWDFARPLAKGVMDGGPATWMEDVQLFIKSGAISEETYFTFSYSPIPGDDGKVGGLLNTVQETTVKVRGERQIRMLRDLAAHAAEAKSEDEAWRIVAEVLSANELDLPFVQLLILDEKGDRARLVATGGAKWNVGTAPAWPYSEALREGHEVLVEELAARFGALPVGKWGSRCDQAILLPLLRPGQSGPQAFLAAGVSPHRAFDDRYRRFYQATADQVANVIASARAFEGEKKRAEALAELDRAKTVFFNNISHEFRTPLTLILGPIEDALNSTAQALSGEELAAAHRNAVRLLRLVNNLLDYSRLESGRIKASFSPVDLAKFTSCLAGSFGSLVEGAGLRLIVDCPPLPERVYVDPELWEKIVLNLVSNAFKFTFKGEIRVSLLWRTSHVELSVQDTGTGIPEAELPRIFERFHRVAGAKGRSFEGSGIGLALVHELAVLHGGTVRVTSEMGKGSEFTVSIPTGSAHLPAEQIASGKEPSAHMEDASAYFLETAQKALARDVAALPLAVRGQDRKDIRILIADDNADMREYLVRLLGESWAVEAVADGAEALASAKAKVPDLVLSDIMMPVMDGVALLRELRADPQTREIPVVLVSARAGEETLLEGLDTGADDYLVKPFSARELIARENPRPDRAASPQDGLGTGERKPRTRGLQLFRLARLKGAPAVYPGLQPDSAGGLPRKAGRGRPAAPRTHRHRDPAHETTHRRPPYPLALFSRRIAPRPGRPQRDGPCRGRGSPEGRARPTGGYRDCAGDGSPRGYGAAACGSGEPPAQRLEIHVKTPERKDRGGHGKIGGTEADFLRAR